MTASVALRTPTARPATSLRDAAVHHVWHHATQVAQYADAGPLMLTRGAGVHVWDDRGNKYIDGTSILGVSQVGHGRREIADAVAAQICKLEYASLANGFSNEPAAQLAVKLAEMTPGHLTLSYFCSTGSEAVDTAIKATRQYHRQKGEAARYKIIGRRGSYHGITLGALSATGITSLRTPFGPLLPGFSHIAQPYTYRRETELGGCGEADVGRVAADALEQQILFEGPETVAAFIAEPIALPQAIKVPPEDYWPRIQTTCKKYGVLLITDEVFNGFGRTGRMFASEHFGIEPDIMVMSKGLTSGYIPLSAAIVTERIADAFWGEAKNAFHHGGTYSGHPVACAAALANLDIIDREDLVANSAAMGERLMRGLTGLGNRRFVGNVSGRGLLTSVELVKDAGTKEPAPLEVGAFLRDRMTELGLIARFLPNAIYFYPPLTVTTEDVDCIIEFFERALSDADARFPATS
jgi:putrescine---pyruvate transaminase